MRTGRDDRDAKTGLLEDHLSHEHASLEGENPVPRASSGAAGTEHDDDHGSGPARGQESINWMQIHHSAAHAFQWPHCPFDCEAEWIGDGWCDTECNVEACKFDGGDCHGWCGGECRPHWPGDDECDLECYKEECQWDGGDCPDWQKQKLPSLLALKEYVETYKHLQLTADPAAQPDEIDRQFLGGLRKVEASSARTSHSTAQNLADESQLAGAGLAQEERGPEEDHNQEQRGTRAEARLEEGQESPGENDRNRTNQEKTLSDREKSVSTRHDALLKMVRGDTCECDAKEGKLGNGVCNPECNTYACHFDGFDCHQMCSLECPHVWLGDGKCDKECDIPECFHDKGDCWECAPKCRLWMIGNNICDTVCNTPECWFDHGDCNDITKVIKLDYTARPYVYQFCARDFIGDGKCDENCYNEESAWDAGDCAGVIFEGKAAERQG